MGCEFCGQGDYELFLFGYASDSSVRLITGEHPAIACGDVNHRRNGEEKFHEDYRYDISYCPWCGRKLAEPPHGDCVE